jgi:hypothetical protein
MSHELHELARIDFLIIYSCQFVAYLRGYDIFSVPPVIYSLEFKEYFENIEGKVLIVSK